MMKKRLSIFLCIVLCVSVLPAAQAEWVRDTNAATALAAQLKELHLFLGVGEAGGTTDFALTRAPSRVEALVMLLRALGKGAEAEDSPKTHPFTDVPAWADGYVSYAYDNGLTNGVSETEFNTDGAAPCETYLTFMLRALGYSDGADGDFQWNSPWALAARCGILPVSVNNLDFTRADVVSVTCAALYAEVNGTGVTLAETLIATGVFTAEQFETAFPEDPFAAERLLDARVSAAIAEHTPLGAQGRNRFAVECHIMTDVHEQDGVWTVTALVGIGDVGLNADGSAGGGSSLALWLIELDSEAVLSCRTESELYLASPSPEAYSPHDFFSEQTLDEMPMLSVGLLDLCTKTLLSQVETGQFEYRQPTYAEALEEVTSYLTSIIETWETEQCTVLLGEIGGTPHGTYALLSLIYKPGSAVREGETRSLPMPSVNGWGLTDVPEALWLSEDGLTLYYTYHFDAPSIIDPGAPSETIVHEGGTYVYTVDLTTGKDSLEIIPDEGL